MKSELVYNVLERTWSVKNDDLNAVRLDHRNRLQVTASSMRAQQLFAFEGGIYYRTEGFDIYRVVGVDG